tara:strand:- start:4030 stop:4194 length:165 start_codon:yes stop_codon:yes gene_type:complete
MGLAGSGLQNPEGYDDFCHFDPSAEEQESRFEWENTVESKETPAKLEVTDAEDL